MCMCVVPGCCRSCGVSRTPCVRCVRVCVRPTLAPDTGSTTVRTETVPNARYSEPLGFTEPTVRPQSGGSHLDTHRREPARKPPIRSPRLVINHYQTVQCVSSLGLMASWLLQMSFYTSSGLMAKERWHRGCAIVNHSSWRRAPRWFTPVEGVGLSFNEATFVSWRVKMCCIDFQWPWWRSLKKS